MPRLLCQSASPGCSSRLRTMSVSAWGLRCCWWASTPAKWSARGKSGAASSTCRYSSCASSSRPLFCSTMATVTASSSVSSRAPLSVSSIERRGPGSALLVRLQVVLEDDGGVEKAVGLLRLVFEMDLGELDRHRLGSQLTARVFVGDAGDDHVVHLDDQIFVLSLAGFALRDHRFRQMFPGR